MSSQSGKDFLYRSLFRLKVHETHGDAFQALFNRVMELSEPQFQAIAPWGNWGDGGNDGWIEAQGHYFQVYGPKPGTSITPVTAVTKAVEDFKKLPKKWANVKKYSFVMNDRFVGIPAPVASALQKLKAQYHLVEASPLDAARLTTRFMALPEDLKMTILGGGVPDMAIHPVDTRPVADLLSHLADKTGIPTPLLKGIAPEFEAKIAFNGLTSPISDHLRVASYQTYVIEDFLSSREPGLKQAIAEEMKDLYEKAKAHIPKGIEDAANLRFLWMIEQLIPAHMRGHIHSVTAYRTAAQIILAAYFETCDVYDNPISHPAA